MALFQLGSFVGHSGRVLEWKIEADALLEEDWACLAFIVSKSLVFGEVVGIPRGGLRFAAALEKYRTPGVKTVLIADDVFSYGTSMNVAREDLLEKRPDLAVDDVLGVVAFNRNLVPIHYWVLALFTESKTEREPGKPLKVPKDAVELVYVEGWKGKDKIGIYEQPETYVVIEHRKEKGSGEVGESGHKIPRSNVSYLWEILLTYPVGETKTYKDLVCAVIIRLGLHDLNAVSLKEMLKSFNGGTNRAAYYFPRYYFCLKILEAKGYIKYSGRGGVTRLKDDKVIR
jgi:hypothetical protein